jgi:branched-chain amino acid transport system ATP-binding protein
MSEPILKVEAIVKNFGGLCAVNSVSFEIKPGEIVGLIGPNGAGKTTLFNVISGYHTPTEGKVFFKGKEVTGFRPYQLAELGIGRTFQVVKPFRGLTVLENVIIASFARHPKRRPAEEHAWKMLKFTGLDSQAAKSASSLTLAGLKRLELSKALALEPTLLLLDEVVAGLNPSEADKTIELILKIREKGISILIVEHIMRVIMNISDRVVVLNFGKQIALGRPTEVAGDPVVIQAYLGEEAA